MKIEYAFYFIYKKMYVKQNKSISASTIMYHLLQNKKLVQHEKGIQRA